MRSLTNGRWLPILLAVLASCSPQSDSTQEGGTSHSLAQKETPHSQDFDNNARELTVPHSQVESLDQVLALLPPAFDHSEYSVENPPSFGAYEEAVLATTGCIETLGLEVVGPVLAADGEVFGMMIMPGVPASTIYLFATKLPSPGTQPLMSANAATDLCRDRYIGDLELSFFSPTEAEIRDWYEQVRTCLIQQGTPEADGATDDELRDLLSNESSLECLP